MGPRTATFRCADDVVGTTALGSAATEANTSHEFGEIINA
jgi:hypothetical protein